MQLNIDNISFGFNGNAILSDFSMEVKENEFVSIVGLSGCGKTTLLNLVAGFLEPSKGEIKFNNQTIKGTSSDRVMVFQEDAVFPWYSVFDNIAYSVKIRDGNKDLIPDLISSVGLNGFENYYPKELSGGMKKRVDLARAYAANPKLLLMDEPFGALDSYTRQKMQQLLLDMWRQSKKTILFVTHDINEAILLSDRIILMNNKRGNIHKEYSVKLIRPRTKSIKKDPEFTNLWSEIENELSIIEEI